jgi:tetratricopeptide (TPR) repeat protein
MAQMTLWRLTLAIVLQLGATAASYGQGVSEAAVEAEINTLREAIARGPVNATMLVRLSQAYAVSDKPEAALAAIEGALALEPEQVDYLRARAMLATWAGHYDRARDSYRLLGRLQPLELDITLNYARVSAWAGDTDNAVSEYRKYLAERPDAANVWLELARAESWRGNYASASSTLSEYRERFGESPAYLSELAGVMAIGGRPSRAQEILAPMLAATPDSYELNLTRALALAKQQRAREAFDALDKLRLLAPDPAAFRNAERAVRVELRSSAEPRFSFYSDSDHLEVQRFSPAATLALSSGTRITGSFERTRLQASTGSGLEAVNGSPTARVDQVGVGVSQKVGRASFGGQLGQATVDGHERTTYAALFQLRPIETLHFSFERMEGLFVVSPRTVSLGLTQMAHRVQADWAIGMRYHLAVDVSHQNLSDGNERLEIAVSPRLTIARMAGLNLDMGLSAYRLETARNLDNGYYDPRRYEHYAITAFPYFKLHENVGLAVSLAGGVQRDRTFSSSFHFGGTISGEATFGIYSPWFLKVHSSATTNLRLDSGAFRGFGAGIALVRRF